MSAKPMLKPAEKRLICTVWGAGLGLLITAIVGVAVLECFPEHIEALRDQYRPFQLIGWVLFLMLIFPAGLGGVLGGVLAWKVMRPGDSSRMAAVIRGGGIGATLALVTPMIFEQALHRYWRIIAPVIQGYEWRCYVLLILAAASLGAGVGAIMRCDVSPAPPMPADVDLSPFHARKDAPPRGDDQITRAQDKAVTRHGGVTGEDDGENSGRSAAP